MEIIRYENVTKTYGDLRALDRFTLSVKSGEVFGLLGPNGSGKTTALNCLLSLLKYDSGSITVFGQQMAPTAYDIKERIGVVFQDIAVFDQMSVFENVDYFCGLYVKNRRERRKLTEEAISFVGLDEHRKKRPKQLSGGLLRRLNIACGIAHKPELIILDEPTVAVDPQTRNRILEGIEVLNREGSTIVYTTHYIDEVERLCTRVAIMDYGKIIADGSPEELKHDVGHGEKVAFEDVRLSQSQLDSIGKMSGVDSLTFNNGNLEVTCASDESSVLGSIVQFMADRGISFSKISTKKPSLNDVFLELTGRELRD